MTFSSIKKSALAEDILERVLELIRERELLPGDKLPPERQLAALLNVSRPSLREALRALALMNIIEIRHGDGTYVTSLEPGLLTEPLDFIFALDDSTILQLFEARRILEVEIAALAAERITDEEIAALEECLAQGSEQSSNPQHFLEIDVRLHELIANAANNPIISRIMASIRQLGMASRRRTAHIPGTLDNSAEDHQAIVTSLKARDPHAARQAMLNHLNHVEARLRQLLMEDGTSNADESG